MIRSKSLAIARDKGRTVLRMGRVFRNYPTVIAKAAAHSYPILAVLRDGRTTWLSDPVHGHYVARYAERGWNYDAATDTVQIPWSGPGGRLYFEGAGHEGALDEVFQGEYVELNVRGRVVLDVGASIGDSAVYFAASGAKRVYAVEPFSTPVEFARRNAARNGFGRVIEVLQAACSGTPGTVLLDTDRIGTVRTLAESGRGGSPVPGRTIPELIQTLGVPPDSVLKLDCEGGEYDILRACNGNDIRRFSQIAIEYHYGVQDLPKRLMSAGFTAHASGPICSASSFREPLMETGLIVARRPGPNED
jgi:FkbM family methyltransferase